MPRIKDKIEIIEEITAPPMYRVILHNDDYTSMEFVVMVLSDIFHKSEGEAVALMMMIHQKGKAICGVYSHEIARTKVAQIRVLAKIEEFPLLASIEKDI